MSAVLAWHGNPSVLRTAPLAEGEQLRMVCRTAPLAEGEQLRMVCRIVPLAEGEQIGKGLAATKQGINSMKAYSWQHREGS